MHKLFVNLGGIVLLVLIGFCVHLKLIQIEVQQSIKDNATNIVATEQLIHTASTRLTTRADENKANIKKNADDIFLMKKAIEQLQRPTGDAE